MKSLSIVFALALVSSVMAATVGIDDASNYGAGSFTNGANAGTGFQPWGIIVTGTAGNFLGDSTSGGNGDINTGGQSFGFWGNPSGGNRISCYRKFAGSALSVGQKFSARMTINWRNGKKGLEILSGGQGIFKLEAAWFAPTGSDDYYITITNTTESSLGFNWEGDSIFDVIIEQKAGNVLNVDITRGSDNFNQNFTLPGNADEFQLFCENTDTSGDQNNLYANSFAIIPEPSIFCGLILITSFIFRKVS